jgi:hypothetical protein
MVTSEPANRRKTITLCAGSQFCCLHGKLQRQSSSDPVGSLVGHENHELSQVSFYAFQFEAEAPP